LFATSPAGEGPFDKRAVGRDFDRAAAQYDTHAGLQREVAGEVADGLVARLGSGDLGPLADLGCGTGLLGRALGQRGQTPRPLIQLDLAPAMAHRAHRPDAPAVVGDAERLPLASGQWAAVASSLTLQWCNDLPGVLAEARRALAPGGLFLAATVLDGTLTELASALAAVDGGRPPVGPFYDADAVRQILADSGLSGPACLDASRRRWAEDPLHVLRELRGLGATAKGARHPGGGGLGGRGRLQRLRSAYREVAAAPDGPVPATWNVAFLVAWKPAAS
jgi:malonyl-CoA O-methyltransferase